MVGVALYLLLSDGTLCVGVDQMEQADPKKLHKEMVKQTKLTKRMVKQMRATISTRLIR